MSALGMRRIFAVGIAAASSLLLLAGTAHAGLGDGDGTQEPSGDHKDGTLSAGVGAVVYDHSKNGSGSSVGSLTPPADWSPPPCWYAPKYTPEQLKAEMEPIWEAESTGYEWDAQQRDRYVNGKPYKDFNEEKSGEGYFWDSYVDESYPSGWDACDEQPFWVDEGDPPPANIPESITTEMLAELAYAEVRVPGTEVELSPTQNQKVNLPTWAWLDESTFRPVSVTASIEVLNLYATTTATPVSLKIEPGTKDAELHPGSGECTINEDGSIGTPYTKGAEEKTPPCGLTYLRSSRDGTFPLRATVTWEVEWTGSGGTGGDLPDGTFGTTQEVTVQEVQAINR
ncbi:MULTISPECIES: hypothetical protein [unclassified Streptomyces]|uniref:hypothetical protein n=1 Tax=unclassified Streptomyces TaxID=2593676 RepID=UPI000BF899D9|nr:hypothetical protein [Streptomyces sp. Ru87]PGH48864.1 hypothetical protein CRI70_20685 [Streptomyces sp. Ru87]